MDEVGSYVDIDDPESRKRLYEALEKLEKSSRKSKRSKKKSDEKAKNREDPAKSKSSKSSKQTSTRAARETASIRTAREKSSKSPLAHSKPRSKPSQRGSKPPSGHQSRQSRPQSSRQSRDQSSRKSRPQSTPPSPLQSTQIEEDREVESKFVKLTEIEQDYQKRRYFPELWRRITGKLFSGQATVDPDLQSIFPRALEEAAKEKRQEILQYFLRENVTRPKQWWDKLHEESNREISGAQVKDWLWFCCLVTTDVNFLYFQGEFVKHGGAYFLLVYLLMIYFIVFPVLHLEIFVGQLCQAGVCKTFNMYGRLFIGFGVVIFLMGCLRSAFFVQRSYLVTVHVWNIMRNAESVASCQRPEFKLPNSALYCTSIVNDKECRAKEGAMYFYGSKCINDTQNVKTNMPAAEQYFRSHTASPKVFDINRAIYLFAAYMVMNIVFHGGVKHIRIILAFLYCIVILLFVLTIGQFFSIASMPNVWKILMRLSTPDSLYDYQTYMQALYYGVLTTGVALTGILCSSSFRHQQGDSYRIACAVAINNVLVNFFSCFLALCVASVFESTPRFGSSYQPRRSGFLYSIGTVPEVLLYKDRSPFWIIAFTLTSVITNVCTFAGGAATTCALVRDNVRSHVEFWTAAGMTIFCTIGLLLCLIRCHPSVGLPWERILQEMFNMNIFFTMAIMIMVFIQVYGPREFIIDMAEISRIRRHWNSYNSPFSSWHMTMFKALPIVFVFIQVPQIGAAFQRWRRPLWVRNSLIAIIVTSLTIIVGCGVVRLRTTRRSHRDISALVFVTPKHPSCKRIAPKNLFHSVKAVAK